MMQVQVQVHGVAATLGRHQPTCHYHFDYLAARRRGSQPEAAHGTEIPYVFQSFDRLGPLPSRIVGAEDRAFARAVSSCWTSFARAGEPACQGLPAWPRHSEASDQTMVFSATSRVEARHRSRQLDLLDEVFEQQMQAAR